MDEPTPDVYEQAARAFYRDTLAYLDEDDAVRVSMEASLAENPTFRAAVEVAVAEGRRQAAAGWYVRIVLPAPTEWQFVSEALYGPFATVEDASGLEELAVRAGALSMHWLPLAATPRENT